jgi:hypothetical protein
VNFGEFVDVFVAALYNETQLTGRTSFQIKEILDRYSLRFNANWRDALFKDYTFTAHVDASRRHLGPLGDQHVTLSAEGLRWVEGELGENVSAFLEQHGARYKEPTPKDFLLTESGERILTEDGEYIELEDADSQNDIPTHVSSEAWTGIAERLERDPTTVSRIQTQIGELNREVDKLGLSNHERAKVKAITEALTKLVESPEPEWKSIVELLRSPTLGVILGLAEIAQLALKLIFGIG